VLRGAIPEGGSAGGYAASSGGASGGVRVDEGDEDDDGAP
jgi:hypothetical protein